MTMGGLKSLSANALPQQAIIMTCMSGQIKAARQCCILHKYNLVQYVQNTLKHNAPQCKQLLYI